ncbi:MAG: cheR [Pseudonocardia sp.]|nr:cheR [Pseudonocardia sp.]
MQQPPDQAFEAVLSHLKESRGFDFTGYKRSSLTRRIQRRMSEVGAASYGDYLDYLELHSSEFTALFNTILINVTSFFRDVDVWEYLQTTTVPALLERKKPGSPIRIWSAGCASGEEAYTLAMLLAEALGPEEYRQRVKIYATDVDEEGLAQARQASYTERDIRPVPEELQSRYFEQVNGRFVFRKELRRSVIFGRNDLVQDAPISRIDLLVCRNTLMYFTAETQARILSRFHFALTLDGVLFLGKAEMMLSHGALFKPIELKRRVFAKVPRAPIASDPLFGDEYPALRRSALTDVDLLREHALNASPLAQIILDADGVIALANRRAESMFGVSRRDVGRPFRDLDLSYRPVELRRFIEQAQGERRDMVVPDVEYRRGADTLNLELHINPLTDVDGSLTGVILIFSDVTESKRLQEQLELANEQLETAYEELQSTNEALETTNEELQSTVEELETTNEELQSSNEELETMNEELQSMNDELQTINDELRERSSDLIEARIFLEEILGSLRSGVAVLDRDMAVRIWNRRAEDLWGLRQDEIVGRHFLDLDIGLPTGQLRPMIRRTLSGDPARQMQVVPAINRTGRSITVRVIGSPLNGADKEPSGAILLMELDESVQSEAPSTDPAAPY